MNPILFLKGDQLARIPTLVAGHTRADGTVVAPHMGLRTKRVASAEPSALPDTPLEAFVSKHGGYDRLRFSMGDMNPEQRAKLVDAMAHLGAVEPAEVLRHLGLGAGDIGRDAPPAAEPAPAAPEAPAETDPPPAPASTAVPVTNTDPEVEDAEDREDLASAMAEDPHSDRSRSILKRVAERFGRRRGS